MNLTKNATAALDLSEVQHIERVIVGRYHDSGAEDEAGMMRQIERLNSYLQGHPRGIILAKDVGFRLIRQGEHVIVAQQVAYHIGFRRKPVKLPD